MEPTPLTQTELDRFKEQLLAQRKDLLEMLDRLQEGALRQTTQSDQTGDLSNLPTHMADVGSDTFEQALSLGQMERQADRIREIDEALERIENKTYGRCESDSAPIRKQRLAAIPWTRYCLACEAAREQHA